MTRHEAEALIDAGDLTWGAVKTMLRCEMGALPRKSVVNRGMTHEQAIDILAAAVDGRDDDEVVCGPKCARPTMDRLLARNALRECSPVKPIRKRYCGMCDVWMKASVGKECPFCGADTELEPPAVAAVAGTGTVL